ncbi:MAG: VOC family protein [Rudaea sp.]
MAIRDLALSIIDVDDLDRAVDFYGNLLGLPPAYTASNWARFELHGAALILRGVAAPGRKAQGGRMRLAFQVQNLDEECRRLKEKGIECAAAEQTDFGAAATIVDPEGNSIELIAWNPPATAAVTLDSTVNDIINQHPETMEVFEDHGIRICGGCLVLLNAPVYETAEYSGLGSRESAVLVDELNRKLEELAHSPAPA